MLEELSVQNVKRRDYVDSILKDLMELPGIIDVQVPIEAGMEVVAGEKISRSQLSQKLNGLGYPLVQGQE